MSDYTFKMAEKSYEPQLPTASDESGNLTSEQQDTAKLLEELLGKAVADRYVDFCKLSAGSLGLRVSLPMAAHALREMDSIFRETMEEFAGVKSRPRRSRAGEAGIGWRSAAQARLRRGCDQARSSAPSGARQPQGRDQENRRVAGLAEDGDIAKNWLAVSRADSKAHERKFTRKLRETTNIASGGRSRSTW